jgi:hypothetical protein
LFEPIRAQIERGDDQALFQHFLSWSVFDPRAAVARLEQMPVSPKLEFDADRARLQVCELLGLSAQARWRQTWSDFLEMRELISSGLW